VLQTSNWRGEAEKSRDAVLADAGEALNTARSKERNQHWLGDLVPPIQLVLNNDARAREIQSLQVAGRDPPRRRLVVGRHEVVSDRNMNIVDVVLSKAGLVT
jgi:hypothetical protein